MLYGNLKQAVFINFPGPILLRKKILSCFQAYILWSNGAFPFSVGKGLHTWYIGPKHVSSTVENVMDGGCGQVCCSCDLENKHTQIGSKSLHFSRILWQDLVSLTHSSAMEIDIKKPSMLRKVQTLLSNWQNTNPIYLSILSHGELKTMLVAPLGCWVLIGEEGRRLRDLLQYIYCEIHGESLHIRLQITRWMNNQVHCGLAGPLNWYNEEELKTDVLPMENNNAKTTSLSNMAMTVVVA